jgi:hypothetical protein
MYDIDKDGNHEIALATFNGEVLFFRSGVHDAGEDDSSEEAGEKRLVCWA